MKQHRVRGLSRARNFWEGKAMGKRDDEVKAARAIFPATRADLEEWLLDAEHQMHEAIAKREWKTVSGAVLRIRRLERDITDM